MAKSLIGIKPIKNRVLVGIYDDGAKILKLGGKDFFTHDDTMLAERNSADTKHQGIRPRWALVLAVSDDVDCITAGDKVLLDEMKWSRAVRVRRNNEDIKIWSIPVEDVLLKQDEPNFDENEQRQLDNLYKSWMDFELETL